MIPVWLVVVVAFVTAAAPVGLCYRWLHARRDRARRAWSGAGVKVEDNDDLPTFGATEGAAAALRLTGELVEMWPLDRRAPWYGTVLRAKLPSKAGAFADALAASLSDLPIPAALPLRTGHGRLRLALMTPLDRPGELAAMVERVAACVEAAAAD